MAGKRITIDIIGMHEDDEHVRFSEFIDQLRSFYEALRNTDRVVTKHKNPSVNYRVVDLRHSSPAQVVLEAFPIEADHDHSDEVVSNFMLGLTSIAEGKQAPAIFDFNALEAFKEIGKRLHRGISSVVVTSDDYSAVVPQDFQSRVEVIQGVDEVSRGAISGKVEAINVHAGANEFRIYPNVGPSKVRCRFPARLIGEAIYAINRYATVYGKLKYRAKTNYPYEVEVDSIEVHPPAEELPTLSELRGIAPDITRGMSSEDYVRSLRDAKE